MKGKLYVVSAPSGAGKTSLIHALLKCVDTLMVSISHTTRPKRPGEENGREYHFVNDALFNEMAAQQAFLEHAIVFNYQYGTSRAWVEETLARGIDVLLEIDWQGGIQIQSLTSDVVSIFILPPSREALRHRLVERNKDSAETISYRLSQSVLEMEHYHQYDYLLVNDNFEQTLLNLKSIIHAERLRVSRQRVKYAPLIKELLS